MKENVAETYFGRITLSQPGPADLRASAKHDLFEQRTRYYNYLSKPVTVIERCGMQWEFPAIPDVQRAAFIIQTDWKVHRSLHPEFFKWIKVVRENEPAVLQALRDTTTRHQPSEYEQFLRFRTEQCISLEELNSYQGEIYDHHHDIVVSLHRGLEAGPHPFSELARSLALLNERVARDEPEVFSEVIKIVDNRDTFGARFINRNGFVYRIESIRDPSREDGVWVVRNKPFENRRLPPTVGWWRYPLAEADEALELYKTYSDAEHCGDRENRRRQALMEQEESLVRARIELNHQKLSDQQIQHERELEQAKRQYAFDIRQLAYQEEVLRLKTDLERLRAWYERQILDSKMAAERRKENSELLKQLPAIVGALGAAYLAYKTASIQAPRK